MSRQPKRIPRRLALAIITSTIGADLAKGLAGSALDRWREDELANNLEGLPGRLADILTAPDASPEAIRRVWQSVLTHDSANAREVVLKGLLRAEVGANLRKAPGLIIPTSSRLQRVHTAAGPHRSLVSDLNGVQLAYRAAATEQKPLRAPLNVLVPGPYLTEAALLEYMRSTLNVPLKLYFTDRTFSALSSSLKADSAYDMIVCTAHNVSEVSRHYQLLALGTSLGYSLIAPTEKSDGGVAVRRYDPRSAGSAALLWLRGANPLVQNLETTEVPAEESRQALGVGTHLIAWGALRHAYRLDGSGVLLQGSAYQAQVVILVRRNIEQPFEVLPRLRAWYAVAAERLADPRTALTTLDALLQNRSFADSFTSHVGADFWRFAA